MRIALFFVLAGTVGCNSDTPDPEPIAAPEPAPEASTDGFVCPMHPAVTSKEAGSCSECGMDLVAKPAEHADGHGHDH